MNTQHIYAATSVFYTDKHLSKKCTAPLWIAWACGLLMSFSTNAEEYYWTAALFGQIPPPTLAGIRYSTQDEACTAIYDRMRSYILSFPGREIITEELIESRKDSVLTFCTFKSKFKTTDASGRVTVTNNLGIGGYTARSGDRCPGGGGLNLITSSCGYETEMGSPGQCFKTPAGGGNGGTGAGGGRGPSKRGPITSAGNPINFSVGNKYQEELDYVGSHLSFSRAYNSLDGLWRHSYSTSLRIKSYAIALVHADGREVFFSLSGGAATAPLTELGKLEMTGTTWAYRSPGNEVLRFDEQGRLTRMEYPQGFQQVAYGSAGVTVTDHLGHNMAISVRVDGQPASLIADGLQVSYGYNAANRLVEVTHTQGGQIGQRQYHYEDPRDTKLLTGTTDERGVRYATWAYDEQGRAISSEHANGAELTQVAYNADGSRTVTNALGKQTVYRFTSVAGSTRVASVQGEPSANCPLSNSTFAYDTRGLLKTQTDNKGNVTSRIYNARGLETSRTEASGTPQARTITTTWHATLNLPLKVTEPKRITTYAYDAQGRSTGQTVTER